MDQKICRPPWPNTLTPRCQRAHCFCLCCRFFLYRASAAAFYSRQSSISNVGSARASTFAKPVFGCVRFFLPLNHAARSTVRNFLSAITMCHMLTENAHAHTRTHTCTLEPCLSHTTNVSSLCCGLVTSAEQPSGNPCDAPYALRLLLLLVQGGSFPRPRAPLCGIGDACPVGSI